MNTCSSSVSASEQPGGEATSRRGAQRGGTEARGGQEAGDEATRVGPGPLKLTPSPQLYRSQKRCGLELMGETCVELRSLHVNAPCEGALIPFSGETKERRKDALPQASTDATDFYARWTSRMDLKGVSCVLCVCNLLALASTSFG